MSYPLLYRGVYTCDFYGEMLGDTVLETIYLNGSSVGERRA
jgi:hypothetical protein